MGRPRAKTVAKDIDTTAEHGLNNTPKPLTPPTTATSGLTTSVVVETVSELETEARTVPSLGPESRQDPWTPIDEDFDGASEGALLGGCDLQPAANSMDFLLDDTPMDVDGISGYPPVAAILEDGPATDDTQRPGSSNSEIALHTQDLTCLRMLDNSIGSPLDAASSSSSSSSLQQCSADDCLQGLGESLEQSSTLLASTSDLNAAAPFAQMLDFEFKSLADWDYTPQVMGAGSIDSPGHSSLFVYPHTLDSKVTKRSKTHLGFEDDSQSLSEGYDLAGQTQSHPNYLSAILKQIVSLEAEQQKIKSTRIDRALMLESEIQETLSQSHQFRNCSTNNHAYLLELVSVQMMLDLLQKAVQGEFVAVRSKPSRGRVDFVILRIGEFDVTPRARSSFLRKMLQARLYKLAGLVEDRARTLSAVRQDGFAMAGSVLLGDISRGLRTLMGLVEVWSSRHL